MASVRKRTWIGPGGKAREAWCVEYTDTTGKRRRKTPKSGLKKDADSIARRIERELENGTHTPSAETVTFACVWESLKRDLEVMRRTGERASNTVIGYDQSARLHVIPTFGRRKLAEVSLPELQAFVRDLALTIPGSARRAGILIAVLYRHAVKHRWLAFNPLASEPLKLPSDRRREAIPSKEEIRKLFAALASRQHKQRELAHRVRVVSVMLALFAGMRRGEICALHWEDVDLAAGLINVRRSLCRHDGLKKPKTKAGRRTIPMAPPLRAVLSWMRERIVAPSGFVLTNCHGGPIAPDELNRSYWGTVLRAAGLTDKKGRPKYAFHTLRHAFASLMIEQGLNALHIKNLCGHSSVQTTLTIYGHLFPEDQAGRVAINEVSEQFTGSLPAAALILPASVADATETRHDALSN
jgi:integrase